VDVNPAQLALTRLKLHSGLHLSSWERLQLFGHEELAGGERKDRLRRAFEVLALDPEILGPLDWVSEVGPDRTGRYEEVFAQLASRLRPFSVAIESVLAMNDPAAQARRLSPETSLGKALGAACAKVFRLPNLVVLFGPEATRNPVVDFAFHFAGQLKEVLRRQPACQNPFVWQMLVGRFPPGQPYDWFLMPLRPAPGPEVIVTAATMQHVLDGMESNSADLIHLSNILDWLTPEAATATLQSAWRVLKPGGATLIRQLNSSLDIPKVPSEFHWNIEAGRSYLELDRSFFYRAIHLGRKM
jgi:S-adenosylmethionine-diacylglycerol 3-amino-3-carboxypropyl transferase